MPEWIYIELEGENQRAGTLWYNIYAQLVQLQLTINKPGQGGLLNNNDKKFLPIHIRESLSKIYNI